LVVPSSVTYGDTFPLEGEGFQTFCKFPKGGFKRLDMFRYQYFKAKTKEVRTIAFPFEGKVSPKATDEGEVQKSHTLLAACCQRRQVSN
jgi:hypothetical protein